MKHSDFIGHLSHILDIPSSTLRYWEKEGLIRFNRGENNYRTFATSQIFEVGDIAFYRDIRIPIEDLKELPGMDLDHVEDILTASETRLEQDVERIERNLERIRLRKSAIERTRRLRTPRIVRARLPALYDIVFEEYSAMQHRLNDPYKEAAYSLASAPDNTWGATTSNIQNRAVVRPADSEPRLYLNGLMMLEYHNETNKTSFQNNIPQLRQMAVDLGYRPGDVVGTYLLSAFDRLRYTYYDGYVELLPVKDKSGSV